MTFLDKYQLLKKSIPVQAFTGIDLENCELTDYTYSSKNCYFCFDSYKLENSIYCRSCWGKNIVDCGSTYESELCYECTDCDRCYGSTYLLTSNNCKNCNFCAMCMSCSDCFGCVGLTHKQYCIFNKQYSEDEYHKKVAELKKESPEKILQMMLELKNKVPHPASQQNNNENCLYGDHIYDSKNSYWCFTGLSLENSGFIFEGAYLKNCWDCYALGDDKRITELGYEVTDTNFIYHCAYISNSVNCTNCYYSSDLSNCSDCFGCVGLTNKKYCILNNQLTKEKYEETILNIKKELGWRV
jgi:hypothetical protein